ncbi:hypothetical protein BKA56DRAFT_709104, partial [Ilyonectria sp. MPI-CAGE-AT-0026]
RVKIIGAANIAYLRSAFASIITVYLLYLLTILDSGIILYIFNNLTRFKTFYKVIDREVVITGVLEVPILGFRRVNLEVILLGGEVGILYL